MKKKAGRKKRSTKVTPKRNIVPDKLDLRDRIYMPVLHTPPRPRMIPRPGPTVLNQEDTNACTGFALASVVNFLHRRHRSPRAPEVSPYMLYSMAKRYDEFPGSPEKDSGSSLRGAMKGWFKHGACRSSLWDALDMPKPVNTPKDDWWLDAATRPLGAYYRVDTRSVTDMHVALHDVGILYASVVCHDGWMKGFDYRGQGLWTIPFQKARSTDGGHAFVILGYTPEGFIIQNSWDTAWGTKGRAVLTYEDWTEHAMDCWVAQLGVETAQHKEIAASPSLRVKGGKVQISGDETLRDREISPFIVDMENNGQLSQSGTFRTQESDVKALVDFHIEKARERWGLKPGQPTDVAIYAHGGLTNEEGAAATATRWIPALYDAKIFPIFLMWETDLWSTIKNMIEDKLFGLPKPTAGLWDQLTRFKDERLERLFAPAGSKIWGEMKQNADGISGFKGSGGLLLYESAMASDWFTKTPARIHLIGHSAGSIVHCHIVKRLADRGWAFESVNFLAAAATVKLFKDTVLPHVEDGTVKQFRSFHLNDAAEEQDPSCKPYGRSLLYLVSESFEGGKQTEIVGMEKYFKKSIESKGLRNVQGWSAPGPESASTTHGGFDDDAKTMNTVIAMIKGRGTSGSRSTASRRRRSAPR